MGSQMTIDEGQEPVDLQGMVESAREHLRHADKLLYAVSMELLGQTTGVIVKREDLAEVGVDPTARVVKSITTYTTAELNPKGWVSDNRCPEATTLNDAAFKGHIGAAPHAAHPFAYGGVHNGSWCDGFV